MLCVKIINLILIELSKKIKGRFFRSFFETQYIINWLLEFDGDTAADATTGIDKSASVELKQPSRVGELVEGVEMILKCRVDGNTQPTVHWYRNYDR